MASHSKDTPVRRTRSQKIQHFWDYIFPWCVGLGVCAAVVLYLLLDAFTTTKPDYRIGFVCAETLSDEAVELLEQQAARYGQDWNGDGQVVVQLNQYPLSYTGEYDSPYTQMAGVSMLSSDLQDVDFVCFVVENAEKFIASADTILTLQGTEPTDAAQPLSLPFGELQAFRGLALPAADAQLLAGCRAVITKNPSSSTGRSAEDHALWLALWQG